MSANSVAGALAPQVDVLPLQAALAHADRGWPVFPVHSLREYGCSCGKPDCDSPGKHPRTNHGFKDVTTDTQQVKHWWT